MQASRSHTASVLEEASRGPYFAWLASRQLLVVTFSAGSSWLADRVSVEASERFPVLLSLVEPSPVLRFSVHFN